MCTNPVSEPGLIASLEDKNSEKTKQAVEISFHILSALRYYLGSVLLKVHASILCSNKISIRDSKCTQCLGNDKFNNYSSPIKQSLNNISKYGTESLAFKLALKMALWKSCAQPVRLS